MKRSSVRQWMERLKAKTSAEGGFTLIELLLTLAISAILFPVIWGTFITGYKIYEKVSIEAQLREDADYASAMMMKSLYSKPFDYVTECEEDNCLKFVDNVETSQNQYNPAVLDQDKQKADEESFKLHLTEVNGRQVWASGSTIIETPSDFKDSEISYTCSETNREGKCTNAIISLNFKVKHAKHNKQLNLQSQFGF
ncbi:PilW family protein [Bacillus salacetis]|uniref:PilW family protein n=1 Tax=Bacillus salacetis TaxID=2315464 RepID=UPI003B9FD29E